MDKAATGTFQELSKLQHMEIVESSVPASKQVSANHSNESKAGVTGFKERKLESSPMRASRPGGSSGLGPEFNIESITPEIAAKIVKHFILPMFENGASAKVGRRLNQKNSMTQGGSNSIYGELKLSEQLNESLAVVRTEVTNLTESLEIEA